MALLLLFALSITAWAQAPQQVPDPDNLTPQQLQQLSQRFTTTIKEIEVDRQLTTAPAIQECITRHRLTADDLLDDTARKKKRDAAQACFNTAFGSANSSQMEELGRNLNLQSFGLVRGRGQEELRKYFAGRIENALYGASAQGEQARMKDMRIVDHKVYHDLYKSQLGSNLLLDMSRFCYQKLSPLDFVPGQSGIFNRWKELILTGTQGNSVPVCGTVSTTKCLSQIRDTENAASGASSTQDIFASLQSALADIGGPDQQKEFLEKFFVRCISMIHNLCEVRTKCSKPADERTAWDSTPIASITCDGFENTTKGLAACTTQTRLRDHRKNFLAMQQLEKEGTGADAGFYNQVHDTASKFKAPGSGRYDSQTAADGDSIQGLTTPTTSELKTSLDRDSKVAVEEFDREGCVNNPENSNCDKFFYTADQNLRFQNAGLEYMAATAAEKQRINNLKEKKDDLKKYLQEKGYKDLADMVDGGDATQIVAMAAARFETEREASYLAMEAAFKDQVQPAAGPDEDRGQSRKTQLQNQGRSFQELLLFNNVISSYLQVRDPTSGKTSRNTRVLEREVQTSTSEMGDSQTFFQGLATNDSGSDNTRRDGTLDLNQIDLFLSGMNDSSPANAPVQGPGPVPE